MKNAPRILPQRRACEREPTAGQSRPGRARGSNKMNGQEMGCAFPRSLPWTPCPPGGSLTLLNPWETLWGMSTQPPASHLSRMPTAPQKWPPPTNSQLGGTGAPLAHQQPQLLPGQLWLLGCASGDPATSLGLLASHSRGHKKREIVSQEKGAPSSRTRLNIGTLL